MKKISICLVFCLYFYTACQNNDVQPTPILQEAQPAQASFRFLGQNFTLQESTKDTISYSSSTRHLPIFPNTKPPFINVNMYLSTLRGVRFYLDLPSIKTEEYSFEKVKSVLTQRSNLQPAPLVYQYDIDSAEKTGFIVSMSLADSKLTGVNYRELYYTIGEQKNANLTISNLREIKVPQPWERGLEFDITFSCKMYSFSTKQYIDEIKDGKATLRYYYKKLDF